ncbi:LIS1-like proteiny motif [Sesbania bispinosa]|nr:LIS1-like proteiny motif [Sesbania bispinosa]
MSSLSRELVFLILQFLEEEKLEDTVHKLERESSFFFNMKYFEEKALVGEWDEAKQNDKTKAVEILMNDWKVFSIINEDVYKEITHLLTLDNFKENEQLSKYGDAKSARNIMLVELKKLIEANPLIREKLIFPPLKGSSRLQSLINQSLNWKHHLCNNPIPNPGIKTLFTDHTCSPPNGDGTPTSVTLPIVAVAKPSSYAPLGAHALAAANVNAFAGWMVNANPSTSSQSPVVAASSLSFPPNQVSILKHSRTPNALGMMDYQNYDHDKLMTRLRSAQSVDEVTYPDSSQQAPWWLDVLPRTVVCTLHQGSTVTSTDFNPSYHSLLAGRLK